MESAGGESSDTESFSMVERYSWFVKAENCKEEQVRVRERGCIKGECVGVAFSSEVQG
jgi:hypothetical protein